MSITQDSSSKSLEFCEALETVIARKGRHYSNLDTISLRLGGDNAQAWRDSEKFTDFATSIEIATKDNLNDKVCIEPDDNTDMPGRTFVQKLFTLSENIGQCTGRTLLLFHYAGHGTLNRYDELEFYAEFPGKKAILYHNPVHMTLVDPIAYVRDFLLKTDLVILLDCCYSGIAIRGSKNSDRIVEVISAVGPTQKALGNQPFQDQRVSTITFTARVTTEISYQHKEGANSICFPEIIQRLRERASRLRGPQYKLMVGTQAIQVPLKAAVLSPLGHSSRRHPTISSDSSASVQAITPVPTAQVLKELRVVVQVHINSERQGAGVESVLAWFEDPGCGSNCGGKAKGSAGFGDPRVTQAGKELAVAEVEQEKTGKEADETKEMRDQFEHDKEREEEVDRVLEKERVAKRLRCYLTPR
ncbi:hypothetical protein MMC31_005376 [Peltigera leucophlebia]|nr:hypothetical protein [Peltigera leucophlebia]